ncbi:MAG: hydroxyacid dehydrogenase [Candidatus Micrarchaeia archaeon]
MTKPKVLVADNMQKEVLDDLAGFAEVIFQPDDLHGAIQDVDFLVVRSATTVDKELLSKSKKLKAVIRAGVGMNNVDKEECARLGIKALNTPGASTNAVAELAVLLMLGCSRKVHLADSSMKQKKWLKKELLGKELSGKTLGVLGLGRIGTRVAELASIFGMKTIGHDPHVSEHKCVNCTSFEQVLADSDIITLHMPSNKDTKGVINAENIAKMKDGAIIINTGRGDLIDHDALVDALKFGKIHAAGLDVHVVEPYDGVLTEMENVILTPHIAASTREAQLRLGEEVIGLIKKEHGA